MKLLLFLLLWLNSMHSMSKQEITEEIELVLLKLKTAVGEYDWRGEDDNSDYINQTTAVESHLSEGDILQQRLEELFDMFSLIDDNFPKQPPSDNEQEK